MDTSTSTPSVNMNFTIAELLQQGHPEDQELAARATSIIQALMKEIMPVLQYIAAPLQNFYQGEPDGTCGAPDRPITGRAARICHDSDSGESLLIGAYSDQFVLAKPCTNNTHLVIHWHLMSTPSDDVYRRFKFNDIIKGLQRLLREAEVKREAHLKSISARRQKLDEILAILRK